jgi:hypothetical protein
MQQLYGTNPVFIFDPQDRSNEAVAGEQDTPITYWHLYPQFLRDLFTRAFTDGIHDPQHGRVRESEWRAAMARLRDSIVYCAQCGAQNFYDADALRAAGGTPGACWQCRQPIRLPFRIRIGRSVIMLNHDSVLYPHHVDDGQSYEFSQPVAEVTTHPTDPSVWGLKNVSLERWVTTAPDGTTRDIEPGRSVSLNVGTRIQFGRAEGEIRI